jgi:hypothetical protein
MFFFFLFRKNIIYFRSFALEWVADQNDRIARFAHLPPAATPIARKNGSYVKEFNAQHRADVSFI